MPLMHDLLAAEFEKLLGNRIVKGGGDLTEEIADNNGMHLSRQKRMLPSLAP